VLLRLGPLLSGNPAAGENTPQGASRCAAFGSSGEPINLDAMSPAHIDKPPVRSLADQSDRYRGGTKLAVVGHIRS